MTTQQARILTIAPGDDVIAALSSADSVWIQATGHVEGVEVKIAGESADPTRALRGRLTLVSLIGPAGGPLTATLARATDTGLELVGGVLVRARSAGVTACLFSASDASTSASEAGLHGERRPPAPGDRGATATSDRGASSVSPPGGRNVPSAATASASSSSSSTSSSSAGSSGNSGSSGNAGSLAGVGASGSSRGGSSGSSGSSSTAPGTAGAVGWGAVAVASEEAAEQAALEEIENAPRRGDLVDHFSFGLCEVLTEDGDRMKIRDVRGVGRIREIAPEMLVIKGPTRHESGKRLFRFLKRT